jgi:hypothetical protein
MIHFRDLLDLHYRKIRQEMLNDKNAEQYDLAYGLVVVGISAGCGEALELRAEKDATGLSVYVGDALFTLTAPQVTGNTLTFIPSMAHPAARA